MLKTDCPTSWSKPHWRILCYHAISDGFTDASLLATHELFPGTDDSWSGADDSQSPLMTGGSQRTTH